MLLHTPTPLKRPRPQGGASPAAKVPLRGPALAECFETSMRLPIISQHNQADTPETEPQILEVEVEAKTPETFSMFYTQNPSSLRVGAVLEPSAAKHYLATTGGRQDQRGEESLILSTRRVKSSWSNVKVSAMSEAAHNGDLAMVKWLFDNGAARDVSSKDALGRPPLIFAAMNGHTSVVHFLLSAEANASVSDNSRRSALHYACGCAELSKSFEIAALLLRHGATCTSDSDGRTPFHVAANAGFLKILELLTNIFGSNELARADFGGHRPAWWAAQTYSGRHVSCCAFALEFGGLAGNCKDGHVSSDVLHRSFVFSGRDRMHAGIRQEVLLQVQDRRRLAHLSWRTVLIGAFHTKQQLPNKSKSSVPRDLTSLKKSDLKLIAVYLNVPTGRRLRNLREGGNELRRVVKQMKRCSSNL